MTLLISATAAAMTARRNSLFLPRAAEHGIVYMFRQFCSSVHLSVSVKCCTESKKLNEPELGTYEIRKSTNNIAHADNVRTHSELITAKVFEINSNEL